MIKTIRIYDGGKTEQVDMDELEFDFEQSKQILSTMKVQKCNNLIIHLEEGNVVYVLKEPINGN